MYESELKQGTTIDDRYILKEYKGSGSFGEVWLAEDNKLGIDVAIKLYISLDQKGQDEFKEEYKVAYGLSHKNLLIAQYYSVWGHRPYLITKYCSRGSVDNFRGNISETDIWKFIHDVANGLKYLHAQEPPIVHQDIKPENILIDEQGNYLIADFGISKKMRTTMRNQSKRSIESGSIAYMGPERFLKVPMAVKASDIWSLGVSIYELATNDLPFMGQGGGMLNAGAALPELDDKWSHNLNEIMQACLAKDTWDRPTAEDLADYTQQVLKGKDLSWHYWNTPKKSIENKRVARRIRNIKAWAWIASIVSIALLIFIFVCMNIINYWELEYHNNYLKISQLTDRISQLNEDNNNLKNSEKELSDVLEVLMKKSPVIASDIQVHNEGEDYESIIYSKNTTYIYPKATFVSNSNLSNQSIDIKFYTPYGLSTDKDGASDGYSYRIKGALFLKKYQPETLKLTGWGNKNKGHWSPGDYRIEIWVNGNCVGIKHFQIK